MPNVLTSPHPTAPYPRTPSPGESPDPNLTPLADRPEYYINIQKLVEGWQEQSIENAVGDYDKLNHAKHLGDKAIDFASGAIIIAHAAKIVVAPRVSRARTIANHAVGSRSEKVAGFIDKLKDELPAPENRGRLGRLGSRVFESTGRMASSLANSSATRTHKHSNHKHNTLPGVLTQAAMDREDRKYEAEKQRILAHSQITEAVKEDYRKKHPKYLGR